jgi:hypothetical protein
VARAVRDIDLFYLITYHLPEDTSGIYVQQIHGIFPPLLTNSSPELVKHFWECLVVISTESSGGGTITCVPILGTLQPPVGTPVGANLQEVSGP